MKTTQIKNGVVFAITLASSFSISSAVDTIQVSEKAAAVGMLPHQKRGEVLEEKERNPFAIKVTTAQSATLENTNTEESAIRAKLTQMKVSGISKGSGGYKAQVGGLILKEGEKLPQIIAKQTDQLRVMKVTAKTVEIVWIDEEGAEEPRRHILELDLRPLVRHVLPGGGDTTAGLEPMDPRGGLMKPGEEESFLVEGAPPVSPE